MLLIRIPYHEIGPPSRTDRSLPPIDNLRALGPEAASAIQVFNNGVAFAAIVENSRDRNVEAVLFDDVCGRSRCCQQEILFCVGDIVAIERCLRKDQIADIDRISGLRSLAQESFGILRIKPRFPRIRIDAE